MTQTGDDTQLRNQRTVTRSLFLLLVTLSPCHLVTLSPPAARAEEPILRLEAGGPTSFVTALAFNPASEALYAAGFDKVARVWTGARAGTFALDAAAYRVPIGTGTSGTINALAISADGTWLAVAGRGVIRGEAGFRESGRPVVPKLLVMTLPMWEDEGVIYVFNTRGRQVHVLRGHRGAVRTLTFAPSEADRPLLVSAGQEFNLKTRTFLSGVRLWDVTRDKPLAGLTNLPDVGERRPGLAAWRTGKKTLQLRVAIAWEDEVFRVWDVASGKAMTWADGKNNNTVAYLPDQKKLVTCSFGRAEAKGPFGGVLRLWRQSEGEEFNLEVQRSVLFPSVEGADGKGKVYYFPRALTLLSGRPGGKLDHAGIVLRPHRAGARYRLDVVDLTAGNVGAVKASVPLWPGAADLPVVAASPGGRYLAVAGNKDHQIYVFSIRDLLRGRKQPIQKLRGQGATQRYVAWVLREKTKGLLLSAEAKADVGDLPRPGKDGDLVFDFARRRLAAFRAPWKTTPPDPDGWEVSHAFAPRDKGGPKRPVFRIQHNGRLVQEVWLKARQYPDDYALLPARLNPSRVPLLAVAWREEGEPQLFLFNGKTGEPVRLFTGHSDFIRCLAFSPDGRLLASAALDQTVCVWSVAGVDEILGKRGMLRGIVIGKGDAAGELIVASVEDEIVNPDNRGKLQKGDVILGLVRDGKIQPLNSPADFYEAVALVPPEKMVRLRVRGHRKPVNLVVGQGVDQQKPLFSFFVTTGRDWVGWNPLGPYDSSGRAERFIGWHFNQPPAANGKQRRPVSFALADQYRKEYRREGILGNLADRGNFDEALQDWETEHPPPVPKLTLSIERSGRDPRQAILRLHVNDDFPLELVKSARWQMDGGEFTSFDGPGPRWSADLAARVWKRGKHTFHVVLEADTRPREHEAEVQDVYRPPPPRLLWAAEAAQGPAALFPIGRPVPPALPLLTQVARRHLLVDQPAFRLQAVARPGLPGQTVRVRLRHSHQDRQVQARQWETAAPLLINEPIKLKRGDNRLEVVAVNKDVEAGSEAAETVQFTLTVTYFRKDPPPNIYLAAVVPLPDGLRRPIIKGETVEVDVPRIRLEGTVKAADKLVTAELVRDGAAQGKKLTGWTPAKRELAIKQVVRLRPGLQKLRVRARTATSDTPEAEVLVFYRPRLPRLALSAPDQQELVLRQGKDDREVAFKGQFIAADDPQPFRVVFLVKDRAAGKPLDLDANAQNLDTRVRVPPGRSRIELRVENAWGAVSTQDVWVRYLRPPRITEVVKPVAGKKPFVDVTFRVESASDLPLKGATVNDRDLPARALVKEKTRGGVTTWRVRAEGVALKQGKNTLQLRARNEDDWVLERGRTEVRYDPPPPPRAVVTIQSADGSTTEPRFPLRFRIRSESPLKAVEVVREGASPFRKALDVSRLRQGQGGFYQVTQEILLVTGTNRLHIEVVNDGGPSTSRTHSINYLFQPVRWEVDRLEVDNPSGTRPKVLRPVKREGGRVSFPAAARGRVWLNGRIVWTSAGDVLARTVTPVVYVNGFRQRPARLGPLRTGLRERTFRAELLLGKARGNRVDLVLPAVKIEAGAQPLTLDCKAPLSRQRLYLLIVAVDDRDSKAITGRVLRCLGADSPREGEDRFTAPAFAEGRLYRLTGYVSREEVLARLDLIRRELAARDEADTLQDVVMVYFQGNDSVDARGHFFWTSASLFNRNLKESAVRVDTLAGELAALPGAHLLLADVARQPGDKGAAAKPEDTVSGWAGADYSRVGVLRYAWLSKPANRKPAAWLLPALLKATAKAGKLGKVTVAVKEYFQDLAAGKLADFEGHTISLKDLAIGNKP